MSLCMRLMAAELPCDNESPAILKARSPITRVAAQVFLGIFPLIVVFKMSAQGKLPGARCVRPQA